MVVSPANYDRLKIFSGDTFELALIWADEDGAAFDLSSHAATLRFLDNSGATIKTLTSPTQIVLTGTTIDSTTFNIYCRIAAADTPDYATATTFLLEITEPDGVTINRLLKGPVAFEK